MTGNGAPAEPAPAEAPRLVVTFAGPGQSDMILSTTPGVSLSQLMGAAFLLDCVAREARAGEAARAAMAQIAVNPASLPDDIRRMLRGHQ